jgi:DNA-binding phage protein
MRKRIKVDDLPEFDATPYLDSETAIAAYLTDILEANDAAYWRQRRETLPRSRDDRDRQVNRDHPRGFVQGIAAR